MYDNHLSIYRVSVLFNEPKLLKSVEEEEGYWRATGFSALQRAEIAEMGFSPKLRLDK